MAALLWDVYCRVVDNLGDAGVCWRLAADLAARGHRVRLVIDDAAPLAFMAPGGAAGVEVMGWPGPAGPGDVVIEAFGCDPPPARVAAMAAASPPPLWINLEYLSAEAYVERSHGLPSPQQQGPGRGLTKWFFYPGFTARTGGLLREPGLLQARAAFDRAAWWQAQGIPVQPGERVVTLFCYDNPALPSLLQDLARQPTLLLLTPGPAQRQVAAAPAGVRLHRLPWLSQAEFDRLLWSADLNFVRGEDSLVRAIWAGAPFVWQAYPQHDGAHAAKLEALLLAMQALPAVAALWQAWNGLRADWPGLPPPWIAEALAWQQALAGQPDLVSQLIAFAAAHPRKP
ncbi:MAG: elongation factor P maturation arginine rhamnosyltransferase EarP [Leptothrix sp. (in: Bacteria)]|nr:elongation factor P maturation arginine rhamnosyltransferase EarP [Leptothrix sp. (in: b-proteobacteria)]